MRNLFVIVIIVIIVISIFIAMTHLMTIALIRIFVFVWIVVNDVSLFMSLTYMLRRIFIFDPPPGVKWYFVILVLMQLIISWMVVCDHITSSKVFVVVVVVRVEYESCSFEIEPRRLICGDEFDELKAMSGLIDFLHNVRKTQNAQCLFGFPYKWMKKRKREKERFIF